jgi:hypothetical protein
MVSRLSSTGTARSGEWPVGEREVKQNLEILKKETFISGYLTALIDIERTGVRPITPGTCRESAERAWGERRG